LPKEGKKNILHETNQRPGNGLGMRKQFQKKHKKKKKHGTENKMRGWGLVIGQCGCYSNGLMKGGKFTGERVGSN